MDLQCSSCTSVQPFCCTGEKISSSKETFRYFVCAHLAQSRFYDFNYFQSLLLLLQNLPTAEWSNSEVSVVVAEAYKLKYMFAGAPNHLQNALKPTS